MTEFNQFWSQAVAWVWGLPLVFALVGAGAYFTLASRLVPFRHFGHAIAILRGKYDDPDDPGEISHFQALSTALSATIGMGNLAGVAIAIATGGPGALFWMWVAGLVGMATKFFTCTLACMYRKPDENGVMQGGPMYYIEVGLGKRFKPLALMFALCGMLGLTALFQSNQFASLLETHWGVDRALSGGTAMLFVAIVILGGVSRVGKATSRIVPFMTLLYLVSGMAVVLAQYEKIPDLFLSIFSAAFGGEALIGGATGLALREIIITGVQRSAFSNEAGIGTAAMAHGAARTREPVREGLVAMLGPFIDTHVICTLTALVILSTGAADSGDGVAITVNAFAQALPYVGEGVLIVIVTMLALSTMVSYSYYSLKCARYLFGHRIGQYYIYIYLVSIGLGAIWSQTTVLNIMDTAFGLMAFPNLVAALLLSPRVIEASRDYFARLRASR